MHVHYKIIFKKHLEWIQHSNSPIQWHITTPLSTIYHHLYVLTTKFGDIFYNNNFIAIVSQVHNIYN